MNDQTKQAFHQIRQLVNRVARETGSEVLIQRIRRKQAITFEVVPEGSPYGPRLRFSEAQLRNPVFVQQVLEVQGVNLRNDVEKIQDDMQHWDRE